MNVLDLGCGAGQYLLAAARTGVSASGMDASLCQLILARRLLADEGLSAAHANDIDFQIEADFIGLMSPGLPQASNDLCRRAGAVMNAGDGILGGVFMSGMYAAAFFERDPRRVVEAGLAALPPDSPYARLIRDVLAWSRQYPEDWTRVWQLVNQTWDRREPCPAGALHPFNIDAKLNGAYVALGLLYGQGDFARTLAIATRGGQDSDCNPASAAGVLGVMLGSEGIPEEYKRGIAAIADERFAYTDYTFTTSSRARCAGRSPRWSATPGGSRETTSPSRSRSPGPRCGAAPARCRAAREAVGRSMCGAARQAGRVGAAAG